MLSADADRSFSYVLSANGGSGRYAFDIQGLPAGLRNQGAVIAGIPQATGSFPVTIRTYDDKGSFDVKTITINVNGGADASVSVNGKVIANSAGASSSSSSSSSSSQTTTVSVNTNGNGNINVNGAAAGAVGAVNTININGASTVNTNAGIAGLTGAIASVPSWMNNYNGIPVGPAGSAPAGSAPAGSAPAGSAPRTEIGPIPAGYAPGYPTGPKNSYPSQTFPTGTSPDFIPSNLPTQISNYNYNVVATRDTYTTTREDIRSQAVFSRQINANKAVANLLSIIQQLTANVNGVQADIPSATQAVNQAIADQRAAQQKVAAAENANKTLTSNIETVRTQITTLQTNLGKVNGDLANAQGPIDAAFTLRATTQASLDALNARYGNYPAAIDAAKQAVKDAQATLDGLRNKINELNGNVTSITIDIANSGPYAASADAAVADLDNQIAALQAQLDKLRAQRTETKNKSDYYKNLNATGGAQIRQLKSQIDSFNAQFPGAQAALDAAVANLAKINNAYGDAGNSIADLKGKLAQIEVTINNAQKNKDALSAQSATIIQSITSSSSTLNNLLSQVPAYNNALVQAYNDGNDANDRYNQLKSVLDALRSKYLTSLQQLNDAKSALEKARSEKEVADVAVNEQIKRDGGATVLPYSIPGTGDFNIGRTTITTTSGVTGAAAGVRPGSYIGAGGANGNFAAGVGVRPKAVEGDLTHYISNSLTYGVNAANLYPFAVRWNGRNGLRWANGDFGCGVVADAREEEGIITEVTEGVVRVTDRAGAPNTLYLGGCTKLQANKPDYDFTAGDRIRWRGHSAGRQGGFWNAEAVTCYA